MNVNRFEEDLHLQQIKVDRLNTFNKELRSKVDYFVSLLQSMNAASLAYQPDTLLNDDTSDPPYLSRPTSKQYTRGVTNVSRFSSITLEKPMAEEEDEA